MIDIVKRKINMTDELRSKIKWACTFNNCVPKIKNGSLKIIEHTNLAYVEPHRVIIKEKLFLFFNSHEYFYIGNLENWIIDYLRSKTQRIEIDLSQSSCLDEQMLVSTNNLCYKISSNTQLRFLLENMDYSYEISLPEDIFISNYDELIRNKKIRSISIYNSNLFLNAYLLDGCGEMIRDIEINNLSYSISEYIKVKNVVEKIIT